MLPAILAGLKLHCTVLVSAKVGVEVQVVKKAVRGPRAQAEFKASIRCLVHVVEVSFPSGLSVHVGHGTHRTDALPLAR